MMLPNIWLEQKVVKENRHVENLVNEMSDTVAKMNYYALQAELDQVKHENSKVDLVGARFGDGFNHS